MKHSFAKFDRERVIAHCEKVLAGIEGARKKEREHLIAAEMERGPKKYPWLPFSKALKRNWTREEAIKRLRRVDSIFGGDPFVPSLSRVGMLYCRQEECALRVLHMAKSATDDGVYLTAEDVHRLF